MLSASAELVRQVLKGKLGFQKKGAISHVNNRKYHNAESYTLFSATKNGLQMENINEGISHLAGIDIILTSITISLVFHILF